MGKVGEMTVGEKVRPSQRGRVLPRTNALGYYEARIESIGGLGAHLAGRILAEAGVLGMGLNGAHFSSYGSEKKGSPVRSFVRLTEGDREVRTSSPVDRPHLVAVFHEALTRSKAVLEGLEEDGVFLVNTRRSPAEVAENLGLQGITVGTVDALGIALDEKTRVNTAMLGAIVRGMGFMDVEAVRKVLVSTFTKRYAHLVEANLRTFERGYNEVRLERIPGEYKPVELAHGGPPFGYLNAPIGGAILHPANTVAKDLSPGRLGVLPEFLQEYCNNCGLCDMVCPDMCFVWREGVDSKGRPGMVLQGIDYQYCKGCLKCVETCPVHPAALVEIPEAEGYAESHRALRYADARHAEEVAAGVRSSPRKGRDGERSSEETN
jgi:pyruvate ferredoxin oxidoreductase gamma subunit